MTLERIEIVESTINIHFSETFVVKNMEGAIEDTLWRSDGLLKLNNILEQPDNLPDTPCTISNAEVRDNHTTFRGSVQIPFQFDGLTRFRFSIETANETGAESLEWFAESMSYEMVGQEKYIKHIKT